MHTKLMELVKKKNDLKYPQLGIVINNKDPKQRGRVKVKIQGLLEDILNEGIKLPWVIPNLSINGSGGKGNIVEVPEMGARLIVIFPYEDINFPAYTGYWQDKSNYLSDKDLSGYSDQWKDDYPDVWGWEDSVHNYQLINKKQGFSEYGYKSGVKEKFDKDKKQSLTGLEQGYLEYLTKLEIKTQSAHIGDLNQLKSLITEDHLSNFNGIIDDITNTIVIPLATAIDGLVPGAGTAIKLGWQASSVIHKDNINKTNILKSS